jgi:Holliday junction resolvase RusA-like endonuclease
MTRNQPYSVAFFMTGHPEPEPRPRAVAIKIGGRWTARVHPSHEADTWKKAIQGVARRLPPPPEGVPLRVTIHWLFPRPKYMLKPKYYRGRIPHTNKPDRDNLDKAVLDALAGTLWDGDDARVSQGEIAKWFVAMNPPEVPGVHVIVSEQLVYPSSIRRGSLNLVEQGPVERAPRRKRKKKVTA